MAKTSGEFIFRRLGKHFYATKRLYVFRYVRYCTLLEVRDYWRNKADGDPTVDQKMVAMYGSPCAPTHPPHTDTDSDTTVYVQH
jgi:hypothetical protein